jgi:hypothetical protein
MEQPEQNKSKSRLEDLQKIILNTLNGSSSTSFETQINKEGFTHQEVYVALENLKNTGALRITESTTEYSPATDEIHESRKYSSPNDLTRGLKVDIYRKNPKK